MYDESFEKFIKRYETYFWQYAQYAPFFVDITQDGYRIFHIEEVYDPKGIWFPIPNTSYNQELREYVLTKRKRGKDAVTIMRETFNTLKETHTCVSSS